ncbi:MAG: hypothetical protein COA30_07145 [Sulfurimonas sp.]|nr:MAG: hypothetical protein COA30_07145 [Sulfurimonas sp.]
MAKEKLIQNINSTTSIVNNAFSLAMATLTAGASFVWFKEYAWQILAGLEILVIFFLFWYFKSNKKELKPNTLSVANINLFEKYFEMKVGLHKEKIDELNDGYLSLYGEDVLNFQVDLVKYTLKADDRTIRTLDLTSNPALWLTRLNYLNINKKFIESGGTILRVLIIDEEKFSDENFAVDLMQLVNKFEDIGVMVGMQFESFLTQNEIQDFISYSDFSVLVEGKQADKNYKKASSTAFFKESKVTSYRNLFQEVWERSATSPSASLMLQRFRKHYSDQKLFSFKEFKQNEKGLYNEY